MSGFSYPNARRDELIVDNCFGINVSDPYRWLEDPDSTETKAFIDAQNDISMPFLEKCPYREKLNKRITDLWNYEKYGCPSKHGEKWYYFYNTGLQNQSVLYMQEELCGEAKEFIDPNKFSEDGTSSIRIHSFSEDGKYLAYGISDGGSDWVKIKIRKTDDPYEDLNEVLHNVKFSSLAWTHDNQGFFYNMYPNQEGKTDGTETTTNLDQVLRYHRIGTSQDLDVTCAWWPEHPKWIIGAEVSDCGQYLLCTPREGCDPVNRLYFCRLTSLDSCMEGQLTFEKVVDNFEAEYEYITNVGTLFIFKTNLNAPRYKLITIDFGNHSEGKWKDLVPEDEYDVLQWANCINENKLVLCYLHDVKSVLHVHSRDSGARVASLPLDIGDVVGYSGRKKDTEFFYSFVSFLTPTIIYQCNMEGDQFTPQIFREVKVKQFDASLFQASQVFYPSLDDHSLKIPMFIIHRKGIELDGSHPLLLYGYGGFNISICPTFSVSRIVFMCHLGGIVAIPNIRGGGEYGESWHKAGMLKNKQNVFNDFQAAAMYLIENKYTSPKRIAINGGSNGGLLVAACANQRPDLFGCAIAQVGVMDMLRFHKFTIGHAWTSDFGSPDNEEDFHVLIKYSPLHNVNSSKSVQYPATLLLTGDHDDRVVPLHSLKFIACLQHEFKDKLFQQNPLMIRIETNSGHGAGKSTEKIILELTDFYLFIIINMGLSWKD